MLVLLRKKSYLYRLFFTLTLVGSGLYWSGSFKAMDSSEQTSLNQQLFSAITDQNAAELRSALKRGADVNAMQNIVDKLGIEHSTTVLIHAIDTGGHLGVIELLLYNGADVYLADEYGNTPLSKAKAAQNSEIVSLLLNYAVAQPGTVSDRGVDATDLINAISSRDDKLVERLLKDGADPNGTDIHGNTPLIVATNNGDLNIVELLLKKGANPDAAYPVDRYTALMMAIRNHDKEYNNNEELIKMLLDNGASLETKSIVLVGDATDGWTPLLFAANEGKEDIVKLLLQRGANPNAVNNQESTALHVAAFQLEKEVIELLLQDTRVDVNATDILDRTPFMMAVEALEDDDKDDKGKEVLQLFLKKKGVALSATDYLGNTALMLAARLVKNKEIIELLLQDTRIDPNVTNFDGWTALMFASLENNNEAVEVLLKSDRVDPNVADLIGWTALIWSANYGNEEVVKSLLRAGAQLPNQEQQRLMSEVARNLIFDNVTLSPHYETYARAITESLEERTVPEDLYSTVLEFTYDKEAAKKEHARRKEQLERLRSRKKGIQR